jgi:tRNA(Ile)-lysidine synthase
MASQLPVPKISGTYIAAVSGGPDSMAMLNFYANHISLVCHINYHKRATATRDEEILINYCKERNIPYKILHVTDEVYRKYSIHTKNFEAIARNIRYDFFRNCIADAGTNRLLVGHNLDDFIENAIMQREKKSRTLFYGIKQNTQHHGLLIYRPLIDVRKSVLMAYCDRVGVRYGIDETNTSYEILRNRVRKCVEL